MLPLNLVKAYNGFVGSVQPDDSVLGQQLFQKLGVLKCNYKYDRDGGAVGDIAMINMATNAPAVLPVGAIVVNAFANVVDALVGTGADALITLQASGDIFADAGVEGAPWSTPGLKQGIPDLATVADYAIVATTDKTVTLTIEDAALTAGEIELYLFYVL